MSWDQPELVGMRNVLPWPPTEMRLRLAVLKARTNQPFGSRTVSLLRVSDATGQAVSPDPVNWGKGCRGAVFVSEASPMTRTRLELRTTLSTSAMSFATSPIAFREFGDFGGRQCPNSLWSHQCSAVS